MATLRRKKAEPFSVFQRDPGPWPPILLNWMATLAIIMVFNSGRVMSLNFCHGVAMLFSASYTTGYLRFGDSFHYIKSQLLCTVLGLGMMFLFSYFDHRFLRRMVKLGYIVCLILLVLVAYWISLPLLVVGLFFGCKYRFSGPDLDKNRVGEVVNQVSAKVGDAVGQVRDEFKREFDKSRGKKGK